MKNKKIKDKKEVLVYEIFSKIFMVFGFTSIFLSVILDSNQPEKNWIVYGIAVSLLFLGVSMYLRNLVKEDKLILGMQKRKEMYEKIDLRTVTFDSIESLKSGLEKNSYEYLSIGYYFKRVATQGLCYYSKFIEAPQLKDVFEKEVVKFRKFYNERCKTINGILFISLPSISDEDKEYVKKISKDFAIAEEIPVNQAKVSIITVLIDEQEKKGYYFDIPDSYNTKIYTYGCLVLRKLFKV